MSRITINSNIASLTAQRRLSDSTKELRSTFEKLSSGLRITRAGDDAAGLAVSELLNVDQRVYGQGIRNLNDGVSALSIAGAALKELSSIVIRIRELATQSANGVLGPKQRQALDEEAQELSKEFTRIVKTTQFNGIGLLDGETQEFRFQGGYGAAQTVVSGLGGAMGEGTFRELTSFGTEGSESWDNALGDLNGDGVLDAVTIGFGPAGGEANVFLGSIDGTFTQVQTLSTDPTKSFGVSLGDLNGDGILDMVSTGYDGDGGRASIFLGQGDGTFVSGQVLVAENVQSVRSTLGDVNNDGVLDLITCGFDGTQAGGSVFLGIGDGTLVKSSTFGSQLDYYASVAVGDFDGDGSLDLACAGGAAVKGVDVFLGDGKGSFSNVQTLSGLDVSNGVATGDLNADGILDLLGVGFGIGDTSATIFLGTGDGTFRQSDYLSLSFGAWDTELGDLNGDSLLDIVIAGYDQTNRGEITVYLGTGGGSFSKSCTLYAGIGPATGASLGDLNGDGVLDIFANTQGLDAIAFLSNTKNGTSPILPFDLTTQAGARQSMAMLDRKLSSLSSQQGIIGAFEAQLQVELGNLDSARENYIAARSRITDADIAEEAARLARLQILQNASTSVLGQANLQPQIAIQLINGV